MSKIIFKKYQLRNSGYHWQQISYNPFTFSAYVQARYQQVLKQLSKIKKIKILDIGCGDGVLLYLINRNLKAQLTGVDLDSDSLKLAKTKVKAKFIKASAYKLPFKAHSFDLVIVSEIIEHLDDPDKMLKEFKRILKTSGTGIITTPVKLFAKPEDPMHVQEFTSNTLEKLLNKYFSTVTIKTSHPYVLKKAYITPWFKIGRFYFEPIRWLINLIFLIFKINPFYLPKPRPSQQLAIVKS